MNITMSIEELEDFTGANGLAFDAHMDSNVEGILDLYVADWDSPNHGINVYLHITDPEEPVDDVEEYFTVRQMEREVNDSVTEDYSREDIDMSKVASLDCLKALVLSSLQVRS